MQKISFKVFLKSSFWVFIATVFARFSGFIVLPFLARTLEPSGLGIYNILFNILSTADSLSRLGIDAAMGRNGSQYKSLGCESTGRLFGVGGCLIVSFAGLIAIANWLFRNDIAIKWLQDSRIEPWMGLISITIFIASLGIPTWSYLLALQHFRVYSLRTILVSVIGSAITLILTWKFGITGAIWSLTFTALLQLLVGWFLTIPILQEHKIQLHFDHFIPEAIKILKFGLPFYASSFLSSFVGLPLLGYVSKSGGIEQLGYLRVAQSLSQFVSFLPTAIAPVLISSLSASLAGDTKDYQNLKSLHLRVLWSILLLTSLTISFNLDWIVGLLFGATYQNAIALSRLTILITAISSLAGMMSQYVLSLGNTRVIAIIQSTSLGMLLSVAIVLIPKYSATGLLIAQLTSSLFSLIAYVKPALYDLKSEDRIYVKQLAFISFFSSCVSFFPLILSLSQRASIIFSITLITTTFTFLCFQCFSKKERKTIISLTLKLVPKGKISRYR